MNIFVAGATGRVGRSFVEQARAAGHTVSALVRARDGDVTDPAAVSAAVTGDAIVSTLGGAAIAAGTANLVAAAGGRRILAVVGAGVLQADEARLRNQLPGYPPFLANVSRLHMAAYEALRDSALEWTLVCCPDIADGPPIPLHARADYLPEGSGRVTTGAVAAFLVHELDARAFVRTRVGVNG